jgi:hypothetical protein
LEIVVLVPVPLIEPGLMVHVPVAGSPVRRTLPRGEVHEAGCVIGPTIGAVGAVGALLMVTLADSADIHPAWLVTLKEYVPGTRLEIVVLVPVPAIDPGLITHVPAAGSPFNTTLPVGVVHEAGWVTVPTTGADGATGAALMTTVAEANDTQPASLVTMKL